MKKMLLVVLVMVTVLGLGLFGYNKMDELNTKADEAFQSEMEFCKWQTENHGNTYIVRKDFVGNGWKVRAWGAHYDCEKAYTLW